MMPDHGVRIIHVDDLKKILAVAAEEGANKALKAVGLDGPNAANDINEARSLLEAYRSAKKTAWQTFVRLFTTALFGALIAGVVVKLKVFGNP